MMEFPGLKNCGLAWNQPPPIQTKTTIPPLTNHHPAMRVCVRVCVYAWPACCFQVFVSLFDPENRRIKPARQTKSWSAIHPRLAEKKNKTNL